MHFLFKCEFREVNEVMIEQIYEMEENERFGKKDEWKMDGNVL